MKRIRRLMMIGAAAGGLFCLAGALVALSGSAPRATAQAPSTGAMVDRLPGAVVSKGDTDIQLNKEEGGDVDKAPPDGVPDNANGALMWDGTQWVINDTWAHTYFTDKHDGRRLITHTVVVTMDGSSGPGVVHASGYRITTRLYTYTTNAALDVSRYVYRAFEYLVQQPDTKRILVRSRGCGLGVAVGYLDTYLEDPYAGVHVAAVRGDPVYYSYSVNLEQAALITDPAQGRVAWLPTVSPTARARYWFDVDNGADMGGYTYHFATTALDCRTANLGTAFATRIVMMWYDSGSDQVKDMVFLPALASEVHVAPLFLPIVLR